MSEENKEIKTKLVVWKILSGHDKNPLQETEEEKRRAGEEYIAKLKSNGENIIEIHYLPNQINIILEDK